MIYESKPFKGADSPAAAIEEAKKRLKRMGIAPPAEIDLHFKKLMIY